MNTSLLAVVVAPLLWKVAYLLLAILVLWLVVYVIEKIFEPIPKEAKMVVAIIILIAAVIILFFGGIP